MTGKRLKVGPSTDPAWWYAEALTRKFKDESKHASKVFSVTRGQKYDRVMQQAEGNSTSRSIHCFVRKSDGAVFKAAGLKKPAEHVRFASVQDAIKVADLYGGYLYLK